MSNDDVFFMDFSKPLLIEAAEMDWVPSPQSGVERRRLARGGAESGHATTIVRFEANSYFPEHSHPGGEEYLILEGVFSDETGDFPQGSYVRNPPGSRHQPFTKDGCTLFVKLCQMQPIGEPQIHIETGTAPWQQGLADGHHVQALFSSDHESVTLERLDPGVSLPPMEDTGGEEILVVSGALTYAKRDYGPQTWLRLPPGPGAALASRHGCILWIKRGHLRS